MKILLMGTHIDGLVLPEKIEQYPHAHKWRVHYFASSIDELGIPYCVECRGMPTWYELEEREVEELPTPGKYKMWSHLTVYGGSHIIVERDESNMAKVVHCKKEPYDYYIGRPSKFGNPFSHQHGTLAQYKVDSREEAIECYRNYIMNTPWLLEAAKNELKGKILGCWCHPLSCHGDVLVEIANKEDD